MPNKTTITKTKQKHNNVWLHFTLRLAEHSIATAAAAFCLCFCFFLFAFFSAF